MNKPWQIVQKQQYKEKQTSQFRFSLKRDQNAKLNPLSTTIRHLTGQNMKIRPATSSRL